MHWLHAAGDPDIWQCLLFNRENNEQEANHQEKTVGNQEGKEEADSQEKSFC